MFTYQVKIYLRDTDATGVIYFNQQLRLALEAFEAFLSSRGHDLHSILEAGENLYPIVHCEADFSAPIKTGDTLAIYLSALRIGTSSFTLHTKMTNQHKKEVGTTTIVHVCTLKKTGASTPIPEALRAILDELVK